MKKFPKWHPVRLHQDHTQAELLEIMRAIEAEPENRETNPRIPYIFKPAVRKKLDAIYWAIYLHGIDTRAAIGDPVKVSGYSGRNSNNR